MNRINFQKIADTNNLERLLGQICFLKHNTPLDKQAIQKLNHELVKLFGGTEVSIKLEQKTTEIIYHKLWGKLTKFHKINRITHYISNLKNISKENAEELITLVLKKLFEDKIFMATNESYKKSTSKKHKYIIDYDPINGVITDIEGISFNGEYYETEY